MKAFILVDIILFSGSNKIIALELPDRNLVLKQMILSNEYFMKKWPVVGKTIGTNWERPGNILTRGAYY